MSTVNSFLFPTSMNSNRESLLLLAARLIFGVMFLHHGIVKVMHYSEMASHFPDPLHIGGELSFALVVFAEFVCALAFISGLLFRLSTIPMIFDMFVAAFLSSPADKYSMMELPLLYLFIFILIYIAGPGRYSLDYLFVRIRTKSST